MRLPALGIRALFVLLMTLSSLPMLVVLGIVNQNVALDLIEQQIQDQRDNAATFIRQATLEYTRDSLAILHLLQTADSHGSYHHSDDGQQYFQTMEACRAGFPLLSSIRMLDGNGRVIMTSPASTALVGNDESRQDYFRLARQGSYWAPARIGTDGGAYASLSAPAGDHVLVLFLDLRPLQASLAPIAETLQGTVTITDQHRTIIADSDYQRVLAREHLGDTSSLDPRWYKAEPLSDTGWTVHIFHNPAILYRNHSNYSVLFNALLASSALISLALILLLTRRMARSIKILSAATATVSAGTFQPVTLPARPRELHELARHFNTMAQTLLERERDISAMNATLEERIQHRTSELESTRRKLEHAERRALVARLISGIAHEMNTPVGIGLTASTYAQDLVHEAIQTLEHGSEAAVTLPPLLRQCKDSLQMITHNMQRASQIIGNFKTIALDYTLAPIEEVSLQHLCTEVLSMAQSVATIDAQISIDIPPDLTITTRPAALARVLENLAGNSFLHAFPPDFPASIMVSARQESDRVVLSIADNGRGLPPQISDHLFVPFQTTLRDKGHIGLGLHTVQSLTSGSLEGSITHASRPGGGAAFTITLPRQVTSQEPTS